MKNEKNYVGFRIPKVWQILKRFVGASRWAQTSYFWRVNADYLSFFQDKSKPRATTKYQ